MPIQHNFLKPAAGWRRFCFVLCWAGIAAVCLLLSHYSFLQGDDFLHMAIGGQAYGRFSAADWLRIWHDDYFYTNGRMADALLRLILRPGVPAARLVIGLTLTALIAALYTLSRLSGANRTASAPKPSTAWGVICLGAFCLLLYSHPYIYADCIGWFSGAVNYLLPSSLILWGLVPSFYWSAGQKPPAALTITATLLLVIGQLAHEQTDLAVAFFFLSLLLFHSLKRRSLAKGQLPQMLLSLLVTGLHMAAPGIRRRLASLPDAGGDKPLVRLWLNTADSSQELVWVLRGDLMMLAGVLLLLLWRPACRIKSGRQRCGQSLLLLLVTAANLTLMYLRRSWGLHALTAGLAPGTGISGLSGHRIILAAESSLALIALAVVVAVIILSDPQPLVQGQIAVLAALIGAAGIPLALGSQNVRSYLTSGILLSLLYLSLLQISLTNYMATNPHAGQLLKPELTPACRRPGPAIKVAAALLSGLVLFFSVQLCRLTVYRAKQNAQVWTKLENKLSASAQNPTSSISMLNVEDFPYPDYLYFKAYDQGRYEAVIRLYYAVPASCRLTWPAA